MNTNPYRIPFNRPTIVGKELYYISQAIHNGYSAGDANFTQKCHALLQQALGVTRALLTTSGTDALEMTALLLDLQSGDEVIVPSFTFVSTANAFALRGRNRSLPIFVPTRSTWMSANWNVWSHHEHGPSFLSIMPGSVVRWPRLWKSLPATTWL